MLQILFPVAALCTFSVYIFQNIKYFGPGVGLSILVLYFFLFVVSLVVNFSESLLRIGRIKYSLLITILFLTYTSLRYFADSGFNNLAEFTVGTHTGLVLAFFIGLSLSILVAQLFRHCSSGNNVNLLAKKLLAIFFMLTLYLSVDAFLYLYSNVSDGIFLTSSLATDYQRPGNFILMSSILNIVLVSMLIIKGVGKSFSYFLYIQLMVNIVLSQLFGSNNATASITILTVMYFVYSRLIIEQLSGNAGFNINIYSLIFGKIAKSTITTIAKLLLIGLVLFYASFVLFDLNLPNFRILNTLDDSLGSRLQILSNDFMVQFLHSPIFGNMDVHNITGARYPHSLISIITHLGVTGWLFFTILMFFIYKDIRHVDSNKICIYTNDSYSLLRLLIISVMVILVLITSFFTWMPFWFSIGLLGVSLYCDREK